MSELVLHVFGVHVFLLHFGDVGHWLDTVIYFAGVHFDGVDIFGLVFCGLGELLEKI